MGLRGCEPYSKYYSVYNRKTDEPVIIHAKAPECMAAAKLKKSTFFSCVSATTKNSNRKRRYDIFVDEPESCRYYSVYIRKTGDPVVMHGTEEECRIATGLAKRTFGIYVSLTMHDRNKGRKYDIFLEEGNE